MKERMIKNQPLANSREPLAKSLTAKEKATGYRLSATSYQLSAKEKEESVIARSEATKQSHRRGSFPFYCLPLTTKQKATGKSGFTMIELLVVIVVMGIILAFSIPAINTTKLRFGQAVDGVYSKLKFARQEAMTKGINYGFNWNSTAFWMFKDIDGDTIQDGGEPFDTLKFGAGITLTSPYTGPVDFNLDGTATQGVALGLVSPSKKDTVWFAITVAGFIYKNQ